MKKEYYIQLKVDREFNEVQEQLWRMVVEKFLNTSIIQYIKDKNDDLFVYRMTLATEPDVGNVEIIVKLFDEVYPRDFDVEASITQNQDDTDIDIEPELKEHIERMASKFLHNRWVENQITEGWRFGLRKNQNEKTDPRLRDWDSLNEQFRQQISLTPTQAYNLMKSKIISLTKLY